MAKISIKNVDSGSVSVNAQDSSGATNGYFVGDLKGGESAEYEVAGNQTLVISESRAAQPAPAPAPQPEVAPAPAPKVVPVQSTNFETNA